MAPFVPTITDLKGYLGAEAPGWSDEVLTAALATETTAQSRACAIPHATDPATGGDLGPDYPADLAEALYRRVAHNLATRSLPLGIQTTLTDMAVATTGVGALPAKVRALEAPYRRGALVIG
ncbi:MAG TPA: hypothetical protein VFH70_07710 [Acidimicrobiales bacterium]|nr:hypothetical protein [Acidimicrobiales bacterium]